MSEITKLYENAGVAPKKCSECDNNMDCGFGKDCYLPFTADKQLKIVKFLLDKSVYYSTYGNRVHWFYISDEIKNSKYREFEEALAELTNNLWQNLTSEERQQVKDILK